jgi:hypothetical protein
MVGAVGALGIAFVVGCCRGSEVSMDFMVACTHLCPSLANDVIDSWEHCRGPSDEVRCSCLKAFLHWSFEDSPIDGEHEWATCVCHCHFELSYLSGAGARLVEVASERIVYGCTAIFLEVMALSICPRAAEAQMKYGLGSNAFRSQRFGHRRSCSHVGNVVP